MGAIFDIRKHLKVALIVGAVLLAINAGFYAAVIRPRVRAYYNLEESRAEFDSKLAAAEKQHKELQTYFDKLVAAQQGTEKFFKEILGTKQEKSIEIQREVSEIATEFGIDAQSVSMTNDDRPEDGLERFAIEMPIEGDYENLRRFLARIESSKSFLVVDRINLTGTKEGGLRLQPIINLTTYFNAPWLKERKKPTTPTSRRKA